MFPQHSAEGCLSVCLCISRRTSHAPRPPRGPPPSHASPTATDITKRRPTPTHAPPNPRSSPSSPEFGRSDTHRPTSKSAAAATWGRHRSATQHQQPVPNMAPLPPSFHVEKNGGNGSQNNTQKRHQQQHTTRNSNSNTLSATSSPRLDRRRRGSRDSASGGSSSSSGTPTAAASPRRHHQQQQLGVPSHVRSRSAYSDSGRASPSINMGVERCGHLELGHGFPLKFKKRCV